MIKLFEMFSGYGGASWGLKLARISFQCVGISEIDKYAIQNYNNNFPSVKNYGDCSKINPEDLPEFDLLTGGFPCQDVSFSGNRDLSKGRTNLYQEIIRIAKVKKPKYMILENVKGLISIEENHRRLIHKIVSDLNKIGYGVCWKLLNSKDYGVPQNRERVWIVCKYGGWVLGEFHFPNKETLKLRTKDLLEKEVSQKYEISLNQKRTIFKELSKKRSVIDPDIAITLLSRQYSSWRGNYIQYGFQNSQMNPIHLTNKLMSTLHTRSRDIKILEKTRIRRLTPKEVFRLMGFLNDEINLEGISDSQLYKMAGNGWDVNLASKLFRNLFNKQNIY